MALISLGCPKNLVDSEKMLGLLAESGLTPIADEAAADALIVNTCGFLEASQDESMGEIRRAAERKLAGSGQRLIVAGCLVQRHRAKMLEWCPQIDAMVGVFDRDRIVEAVLGPAAQEGGAALSGVARDETSGGDHPVYSSIAASATMAKRERGLKAEGYFESDAARLRLTPRHFAYLRISEGCNQNCAFCTIPSIRGKMRSKPVPAILAEARELIMDGAFELNLIGQDTTSFGQDIGYGPGLVGMLEELDGCVGQNAGGGWIRLMYAYPSCFTDEMIDAIARLPRVVKYIDMPLQHISDPVLTAMRRRTSRRLIETLLEKLRKRIPGMAIRTTFISGFPGETQEQHEELVSFVKDFGFDAMGVFAYSPEPGTPAGSMHAKGQAVPAEVARERVEELMLAQQAVTFARNEAMASCGGELDVLIEGPAPATASAGVRGRKTSGVGRGGKLYVGRTTAQAPQIDGVTYVQARQKLVPGELVRCRLTDAAGYDLVAQPVEEVHVKVRLPVMR
ncbi:MAG: 30S ribosomal protein S12 methylthiotransferase RimO [Phycisphaeraceae bacterium]|nr:30S ribosomal protein S12 methylthiotransferase RimO [Phycisphaeraceae bacterium]